MAGAAAGRPPKKTALQSTGNMNALTLWDPFRELQEMQDRLSGFLDRRPKKNNADAGQVKAGFKDGVLKARVGEHAAKQPRQIEVRQRPGITGNAEREKSSAALFQDA